MNISNELKGILLLLARESIKSIFYDDFKFTEVDLNYYPQLKTRNAGAFVTLKIKDDLRGCIGYLTSNEMIIDLIKDAAIQAAANDPRFAPVTEEELSQIDIEISILSPAEFISDYEEIKIGEHGLILEELPNRAVLLPQVATENNFNTKQFLTALCEKAGIFQYTWQQRKLNIKVFTATIFSEIGKRRLSNESN